MQLWNNRSESLEVSLSQVYNKNNYYISWLLLGKSTACKLKLQSCMGNLSLKCTLFRKPKHIT